MGLGNNGFLSSENFIYIFVTWHTFYAARIGGEVQYVNRF